jgi:hypothetical protein
MGWTLKDLQFNSQKGQEIFLLVKTSKLAHGMKRGKFTLTLRLELTFCPQEVFMGFL